jgi:hypothetical protein
VNDTLPTDADIPALRPGGLEAAMQAAGLDGAVVELELLKYHPRSRCTFRLVAAGRELAFKAYADDPEPLAALLDRLGARGLASGKPPTAAPLVAFDPELRVVVTGWLEGPTTKALIAAGAGVRAGELAAAWLHETAVLELDVGAHYGPAELLADTVQRVELLTASDPALGALASAALGALAAEPPSDERTGVRHPSFKPSSILDLGAGPGLIDWDGFTQGAPEHEAGMYLASLTRMAAGRRASAGETDAAARAFRSAVADLLDETAMDWYEAAALVKLAARLSRRRPDRWWERSQRLLTKAQALLAERV